MLGSQSKGSYCSTLLSSVIQSLAAGVGLLRMLKWEVLWAQGERGLDWDLGRWNIEQSSVAGNVTKKAALLAGEFLVVSTGPGFHPVGTSAILNVRMKGFC